MAPEEWTEGTSLYLGIHERLSTAANTSKSKSHSKGMVLIGGGGEGGVLL